MKTHKYETPEAKEKAVKEWQQLRLSGLSGHRAADQMEMPQATLYRWEQRVGRMPNPPIPRQAALDYGGLHVRMRQVQKRVVPLREHEAAYVRENVEATCRNMPTELRVIWMQALEKAETTLPNPVLGCKLPANDSTLHDGCAGQAFGANS